VLEHTTYEHYTGQGEQQVTASASASGASARPSGPASGAGRDTD